MPDNLRALYFWRKIVDYLSGGHFTEIFKTEDELVDKVELEYALLNRDSVFYSAVMEWLGKMDCNYSPAERIDWPTLFENPKDFAIMFAGKLSIFILRSLTFVL